MDLDDLRSILRTSEVDVWTFIETSIDLASLDYGDELKYRRDGIVGKLYREIAPLCRNCDNNCDDRHHQRQQRQRRSTNGFKPRPSSVSPFTAERREREGEIGSFERKSRPPSESPFTAERREREGEIGSSERKSRPPSVSPFTAERREREGETGSLERRYRPPSDSPFAAERREREVGSHERNIDSLLTPAGEAEEDDVADEEEKDRDLTPDHGIGIVEEKRRILAIKEQFEDPHQSEDSLIELLQSLADMDITFQALKETDIGRYVNRLRKHSSPDVKRLVKVLVRKWKDLVDEWVRLNGETQSSALIDGDSPLQNVSRNQQNGHHQVPDFGYSPNPHNGSSGSDKNNLEYEQATRMKTAPARREPPCRPSPHNNNGSSSQSAAPANRQKEAEIDPERFASARRRLQENYQEAQNAKKQRTIQVMDIHDIPKPKNRNAFFPRNKGGFQGRH